MAMEPPTALEPRRHQRGEEQGLPLDAADRAGRRRARPVRGLPRRARRRRPTPRPRRSSRCAARSTTGAGPACRSTCAPASAWPRAPASSRSPSASRRRACSRAGSGVGAHGPDHLTFDLADASKLSLSFYGKRPGPGHEARQAEPAVRAARDRPRRRRARGLRAADLRRDERRPHAVHHRRRHRAAVGAVDAAARRPAAGAAVPARLVGAERHPPAHRPARLAPAVRAGLAPQA